MPPTPEPELVTSLDVSDQERLLEAEATVRALCGWHIAPSRTEAVTVDGSGASVLMLPTLHLTAVASVEEDGVVLDTEKDGYDWSAAGFITRHSGLWTDRASGVVVEITHGYATVPPDLTGVVRALATASDGKRRLKAKSTGPFSETYADLGLTEIEGKILDRYRILPDC